MAAPSLFKHQALAVGQLKSGSILCGGVGSGKSRAALAYYFYKECDGEWYGDTPKMNNPKDLYIITTSRKRDTLEWDKECINFMLSRHIESCIYGVNVVVDSWNNISKYCNVCGAFFIFDEQRLVGSGKWVKSFYQIAKKNKWILLSATPGDTWSDYIPVFVANGFYKNKTQFCREHVVYNNYAKFPKIDYYIQCQKLINLRNKILVTMNFVRDTEMFHENYEADYDRDLYKEVAKTHWDPYSDTPIENASKYCQVLRKICNSSRDRISVAETIIYSNPRLIVFYNFDYELDILRKLCEKIGVQYAEWNGHKHMDIPKDGNWVYLVQYTAGAEGWNCIETNTILFYSPSYSYKAMIQAAGRIDRLNTPFSKLYCYHITTCCPIELSINKCLSEKRDFNEKEFYCE